MILRELVERAGEAKGYRKRSKAPELVLVLAPSAADTSAIPSSSYLLSLKTLPRS